jgi:type IV secretory pathway VirB2 component (pilin)
MKKINLVQMLRGPYIAIAFALALLVAVSSVLLISSDTHAVNVIQDSNSGPLKDAKAQDISKDNTITNIVNMLLYILGAIAVIAIIAGGIRYTTANGDASQTKLAKDTILYAVVGLIVAIMAWGIVNFVVSRF